ncbi:MAG: 30S ribosomal protein S2 [Balneolaceae bacterium]|nr:MAG: 30S ribosomal protein S2 [Balneolaceae bacterium]
MPKAASVEELLKSGAHFGHLTRRWNPKMKEFIFMQRNGIHIIDLKKSHTYLQEALEEVTKLARAGKTILFVGTKKQAQEIIKTEAIRCGMPFVTHRWLGGMLTNFSTVRKSISRMEEIDKMKTDGTVDELTKKEGLMLDREKEKLENTLGGIANMTRLPGAIFVVDTIKEHIAINEAVKLNIPIIGMVDTNSDPDIPDYIIPANDDSARTIQLVTALIADAIIEGNAEREAMREEELMEQAAVDAKKSYESEDDVKEEVIEDAAKSGKRRKRRRKISESDDKPDTDTDVKGEEEVKAEPKEETKKTEEPKAEETAAAVEEKPEETKPAATAKDEKASDEEESSDKK